MTVTILHRRGTAAQWAAANPVLATGEPGVETDTGVQKIGDGATHYNDLPTDSSPTVRALALRKGQRLVADELTIPTAVQPPAQSFSNPAGAVSSLVNVTSIANGQLIPWTDPRFQYLGGVMEAHTPAGYSTDIAAFHTTKFDGTGTNADRQGFVPFNVTCQAFEILEYGNASQWLNIYIDGRPVWVAPQPQSLIATLAGGSLYLRRVDFGSRAKRTIKLLLDSMLFGGIYLAKTDSVAPAALGDSIRHLHVADSYAASGIDGPSDQTHRQDGNYAWTMARLLGIQDFWNDCYGGTGFLATQGGTVPTFRSRMSRWPTTASLVSIQSSINDAEAINSGTFTAAALQAEIVTTLQAVRVKYPVAPIVVFGIMRPRAPLARDVVANNASAAAVTATADANTYFVDPIAGGWFSGTGKVGATTGDGTADVQLASDSNHPSTEGHPYMGSRCARAIADILGLTIVAPIAARSDRQYAVRSVALPLPSATLATDPQIAVDLPPNAVRRFRALVFYESTTVAGFKLAWSRPSGATMLWGMDGIWDLAETDPLDKLPGSGSGIINSVFVDGLIINGATAGQLALQAAQSVLSIVNSWTASDEAGIPAGATLDHSNDTGTTLTQSNAWSNPGTAGTHSTKIDGQITVVGGWVGVALKNGGSTFPVTAGKPYTFSAPVNVTDPAINSNGLQGKIEWRNVSNAVISTAIKVLGTTSGVQSVAVVGTAPVGATQAILYIINQSGTVGDQITFYVDLDGVVFAPLDTLERAGTFLQTEPVSA